MDKASRRLLLRLQNSPRKCLRGARWCWKARQVDLALKIKYEFKEYLNINDYNHDPESSNLKGTRNISRKATHTVLLISYDIFWNNFLNSHCLITNIPYWTKSQFLLFIDTQVWEVSDRGSHSVPCFVICLQFRPKAGLCTYEENYSFAYVPTTLSLQHPPPAHWYLIVIHLY